MKIGSKIKDLRIRRGYTQVGLSEKTNLTVRTIQRIENEEVEPSMYSLKKLSEVLKVDLLQLKNKKQMENSKNSNNRSLFWLILLHLSGLFLTLLPSLILWLLFKGKDERIELHGKDIINFQLNMLFILIICGIIFYVLLPYMVYIIPMLLIVGIYTFLTVLFNIIRVITHNEYKYPLLVKIIK